MTQAGHMIRLTLLRHLPPGRQLSPTTNFFEAGLSSSRLTEVLTELRANGVELSLVDLFRFPTQHSLTAEIDRRTAGTQSPQKMPWDA